MTRNDLVFWPLKYLIFEVCRGDYLVPIGIRFFLVSLKQQ
jgi:hypothetical protein